MTTAYTNPLLNLGSGWNLGNSLEAYNAGGIPSETAWGNPIVNKNLLQGIKTAGFTTVRCPVSWMNYIDPNTYQINNIWLNRIHEVVSWIVELGLNVIINLHHDGNNDFNNGAWLSLEEYPYDNPNWKNSGLNIQLNQGLIRAKFQKVWTQISEKFRDFNNQLIFEGANELVEFENYNAPYSSKTINNLNTLNQLFVDTVRASGGNNLNRILIIPGYNTNLWFTTRENGFKIPTDVTSNKIIVSIHYYDPYDFALNENNDNIYKWGDEIIKLGDQHVANWGSETYLLSAIQQLKTQFLDLNIPILIGEYGNIDKSLINLTAQEYRRYYLEYISNTFRKSNNISVNYWDNGYNGNHGFSLFDRNTGNQLHPNLIKSIIRNIDKEIRKIFSESLLEDEFYIYINNPDFNSNNSLWTNFRTIWYQTLAASRNYRQNINSANLYNVENSYVSLLNAAGKLPSTE